MIFEQGSFFNGAQATPEEIQRKREAIHQMIGGYGKASYVGQGVGHMFTGALNGMALRRMKDAEAAGRQSANETHSSLASQSPWGTPGGNASTNPPPGAGYGRSVSGAESNHLRHKPERRRAWRLFPVLGALRGNTGFDELPGPGSLTPNSAP